MQTWGVMPGGTNLAPHLLDCPAITGFVSYGDREPLIDGGPKRLESNRVQSPRPPLIHGRSRVCVERECVHNKRCSEMDGMSKEMTIPIEDLRCGDDSPVSEWVRVGLNE